MYNIKFVDLPKYSKDTYKRTMGDLVKYEDFVTEVTETKRLRGGNLPTRVYTITIMEPDAINLQELEKLKKQGMKPDGGAPKGKDVEIGKKEAQTAFEKPNMTGEEMR